MAARGMVPRGKTSPLQVSGTRGIIANIYASQARIGEHIRKVNVRAARQTRDLAKQLAPKDTHNLEESITYTLSEQGLAFDVYHDPSFFPDAPYQIFQELGFKHYLSGEFIQNAHLVPAWEAMKPHYAADISRAARAAIQGLR